MFPLRTEIESCVVAWSVRFASGRLIFQFSDRSSGVISNLVVCDKEFIYTFDIIFLTSFQPVTSVPGALRSSKMVFKGISRKMQSPNCQCEIDQLMKQKMTHSAKLQKMFCETCDHCWIWSWKLCNIAMRYIPKTLEKDCSNILYTKNMLYMMQFLKSNKID